MRPWVPVVVPALGVAAAATALHLRDPHRPGSWGVCPAALLGISCPGCGGLRAVHLLTDGDVLGAASSNLLVVLAVPVLVLWWLLALTRVARTRPALARAAGTPASRAASPSPWHLRLPRPTWWLLAGVVLLFLVVRNLTWIPLGEWLAP